MSIQLWELASGSYLKASSRAGNDVRDLNVLYNDIVNIHEFLREYKFLLGKTYNEGSVLPITHGLDAANLLIDSSILSGRFWNSTLSRPKTIAEAFIEIYGTIDTALANSFPITEIALVKNKVGINIFDSGETSAVDSVDARIVNLQSKLNQLAADCFSINRDIDDPLNASDYVLSTNGTQTQESSLRDLVEQLSTSKFIGTSASSLTHTITHNLNTRDVVVTIRNTNTHHQVFGDAITSIVCNLNSVVITLVSAAPVSVMVMK